MEDIQACIPELTGLCVLALGLSCIMLMLLRYLTAAFVWVSLVGGCLGLISITSLFWYLAKTDHEFYGIAAMFTFLSMALLFLIACLKDEIALVIELLKEGGKSLSDIPLLVFEPLLTFIALLAAVVACIYTTLWIQSAGTFWLNPDNNKIELSQNIAILFTYWLNIFVLLWTVQIIFGCENMILAGAVSSWYFTRDKASLKGTIWTSAKNMFKYHLGTISFGSLVIAIVQMISILCRCVRKIFSSILCHCLCEHIQHHLAAIEGILKYVTRNGYVITALYGLDFTQAGGKACSLLVENAKSALALVIDGSTVLAMAKFTVVVICGFSGYLLIQRKEHIQNVVLITVIILLLAFSIIHSFMTVYEMIIDTIFLCFCEDIELNNGDSRPYFMSDSFIEFVKKAKENSSKKPKNGSTTNTDVVAEV